MPTVKKFEDLEVWKKARVFSKEIWEITQRGTFSKDYKLRDQINAAAGSIMDNISEGFGRGGRIEFVNFLSFSKGSVDETKSQLYRALDRKHLNQEIFDDLYEKADEIARMITGFMEYLNKTEHTGQKFKGRVVSK